jgi:hypothetical protein
MKFTNEMLTFKVSRLQPRNQIARTMLDRNGPFKDKVYDARKDVRRKPKNAREAREYFSEEE